MNKFVAKSIQGTAYEPGSDENKKINEDENTKTNTDLENS